MENLMARTQLRKNIKRSNRKNLSKSALKTFFNIAELWKLTVDEQRCLLGDTPESTYFKWKKTPSVKLSKDTLERISYILGIYKALQILIPDTEASDSWIKKPNSAPIFGGRSAIDRMLSGNVSDLYEVRKYLDSERSGWA